MLDGEILAWDSVEERYMAFGHLQVRAPALPFNPLWELVVPRCRVGAGGTQWRGVPLQPVLCLAPLSFLLRACNIHLVAPVRLPWGLRLLSLLVWLCLRVYVCLAVLW